MLIIIRIYYLINLAKTSGIGDEFVLILCGEF